MRLEDAYLFVVFDAETASLPEGVALCREAIGAGADLVGFTPAAGGGSLDRAGAFLAVCREESAGLIVIDDTALAAEVGADGVHLAGPDPQVAYARVGLGMDTLVGVSARTSTDAALVLELSPDYLVFLGGVDGAEALSSLREQSDAVFFVGGIARVEEARRLVERGIRRFAVETRALDTGDMDGAVAEYSRAIGRTI